MIHHIRIRSWKAFVLLHFDRDLVTYTGLRMNRKNLVIVYCCKYAKDA